MHDIEMDRRTSGEQAADALREEIISGRIADGDEVIQSELAQSLNLSRMPVREALKQLEGEGFIERLDNRHTRVIGMSEATIASRFALLASMTRLAMTRLDSNSLAQLEEWCETTVDSPRAHMAFHDTIYVLCQDRFLRQLYQRVFSGFLKFCVENAKGHIKILDMRACLKAARDNNDELPRAIESYYKSIEKTLSEE